AKNYISIFGISSDAKIEVYSIIGQKVFEQNFSGETNVNLNLASGIYMAKITTESKVVTKKIVIE
ncbi:MAG: T9SS type A sorting domain-containing protein, partial [Flavobacterium sp.]